MKRTHWIPSFAAVLVVATCTLAAPARAETEPWRIDAGHSQVGFKVRHFFAQVPGRFGRFEGTIEWDQENLAGSKVSVKIDASSIDTGSERRDDHLRGEDFFHVEKHPEITFVSTEIRGAGNGKAVMTGELTMRGVTRPVTLDVDLLGSGKGMRGRMMAGFSASGTLNRQEFGVAWNRAVEGGGFVLGDDVTLSFEIEAVQMAEGPAPGAVREGRPVRPRPEGSSEGDGS